MMPAFFPGGRWDTGQIPKGSVVTCLPVNLEMLCTHMAEVSAQSVGEADFHVLDLSSIRISILMLGVGGVGCSLLGPWPYISPFFFGFFCQTCFCCVFCRCLIFYFLSAWLHLLFSLKIAWSLQRAKYHFLQKRNNAYIYILVILYGWWWAIVSVGC